MGRVTAEGHGSWAFLSSKRRGGMMTGVRSTEGGWTDNEVRYDGMASRAAMVDSTGMTYYAWDGIRVLKTEDDAGALRQR